MKKSNVFCFSSAVRNLEREDAQSHQRSHDAVLSDCVLGFAQMLHVALKRYYMHRHDPESNEDYLRGVDQLTLKIKYPGGPVTTIATLIDSYRNINASDIQ